MLDTVRVPLIDPEVSGLKVMEKEALCPAGIVTGSGRPPILKTELFVVAPVTVTLAPVAFRAPDTLPLPPTATFPKFSVLGEIVSCPLALLPVPVLPCPEVEDEELTPWHPTSSQSIASSSTIPQAIIRLSVIGVSQVMTLSDDAESCF